MISMFCRLKWVFSPTNINAIISETWKFSQFFLHFWNLHQIFNILKKKMSLMTDVFPKL